MVSVHPTAVVDAAAQLGSNVRVGPYAVIEADVSVGDGCEIGSHVRLASGTRLGERVRVAHGAVLGTEPQDLKFSGEKTYLEVGSDTVIREYATLNRGTRYGGKTVVGHHCVIMAYTHIAHDCMIGNHVILANAVNMAGHVVIEDYAGVGGLTPIHQFVRIGQHSFVGGGYRVARDVPPFVLAMGEPLRYGGLNRVGLERRGFPRETLLVLKKAYRILFREAPTKQEALQRIENELPPLPELRAVVTFVRASQRGLIKG
ncbi:MAG: acyl-ACP--UDP-N-acetylglucosamine O-acyltransferase [Calditrichaeota bacterium]|nr:MAG: acyl-ACP--UDP-N-acetylglucosamine O-acyltransferase [Calditrichota bacterium]